MQQALLWRYDAGMPDYALAGCGDTTLDGGATRRWVSAGGHLSFVIRRPAGSLALHLHGVVFKDGQNATLDLDINRLSQAPAARDGRVFSWRLEKTANDSWIKCVITARAVEPDAWSEPSFGFERISLSQV